MSMAGHVTPVDFNAFELSAKIDFVTFETPGRFDLPDIDGKAKWPAQEHGTVLTVHDPSPSDIVKLAARVAEARIVKLEVAVDARPKSAANDTESSEALERLFFQLVAGLAPSGPAVNKKPNRFMAWFDPRKRRPLPFNKRRPEVVTTIYWGHRDDPAQVKLYVKRTDQRKHLPWQRWVTRVEVTLAETGLAKHGLERLGDLIGFRYRKELSAYFRLGIGVDRRRTRKQRRVPVAAVLRSVRAKGDRKIWMKVGAPAFLRETGFSFRRHKHANAKVGDALARLAKRMNAAGKSGSTSTPATSKSRMAAGLARAAGAAVGHTSLLT